MIEALLSRIHTDLFLVKQSELHPEPQAVFPVKTSFRNLTSIIELNKTVKSLFCHSMIVLCCLIKNLYCWNSLSTLLQQGQCNLTPLVIFGARKMSKEKVFESAYVIMSASLSRTFWPPGVELLHGVVHADPDGGEAHLSVQSCHQTAVQTPRTLSLHHGEDGAKHTSVSHSLAIQCRHRLPLNLETQIHNSVF